MDKHYLLFCSMVLFILLMPAAIMPQVLTGTVSSEGTPLAGATVVVKGTTTGTSTNADGFYTLRLTSGTYEIIFS